MHDRMRRVKDDRNRSDASNSRLTLKSEREAVYSGWCPQCRGIVLSGWDDDISDAEVWLAWRCPGCRSRCNTSDVREVLGSPDVTERGVDTWRFVRYLERDAEIERASALCPEGRYANRLSGHRVGFMPGQRMLWVEGRPSVEGLADPAALEQLHGGLLEQLAAAGFPLGRDGGLGRDNPAAERG